MIAEVHTVSSVNADSLALGTRGLPRQITDIKPGFLDRYDNSTLIYDCFWQADQRCVRLYLPKLLGYRKSLKRAVFSINGKDCPRPRLRKYRLFEILDIAAPSAPSRITVTIDRKCITIPVQKSASGKFAGKNVLATMIKNDSLEWVSDWALAHHRNHGANAVVIANNGSTAYSSEDLRAALEGIAGLQAVAVIDLPLPYGPGPNDCKGSGWGKFLQNATLNIMRDRFLLSARAVLLCDIDELVVSPTGRSIFDATVGSSFKYLPFQGYWRHPRQGILTPRHSDHVLTNTCKKPCANKYCVVPNSPLGRTQWSVHELDLINRMIFGTRKDFHFLHCHAITTAWKRNVSKLNSFVGPPDPDTQDFMRSTFEA